ncbi:pre-peptidase C-terminal domain-containing protein [Scytonema hofmannii FACHB-248]|uniref:Pre-peptidase C-terminal domain-containing protein n=1 Tax=Scytonema hofmannii FACHB-248 TaxID=1842502 RepID=A0ABR8GPG8_9CYAN|nr:MULTISPECIES: CAP domain-containing protein [Nostocales]MBD2604851.1 pre-peptidase C-terminal domain-containing protein [Scytonema hofmannii FACHB-248]
MPQNLFDANFYRAANSDLRGLNDAQALSHFQQFGLNENRSFSAFVDLNFYRASNSDLASFSNKQAFEHLQKYGVAEGRKFSPLLDLNFYVADNPDVAQAYGGSREGALSHLETYGLNEGRKFSLTFDINYYRNANSDLAARNLNNQELFNHFALYGKNEGRASAETFNANFYQSNNSDLANFSYYQALQHFVSNGLQEGRNASDYIKSDRAGNTINDAHKIAIDSQQVTFRDSVGNADKNDFYRVNFSQTSNFKIAVNGLVNNADIELLNSNGEAIARGSNVGNASELLNVSNLQAGNYYIRVYQGADSSDTNYNLSLSATAAITSTSATPQSSNLPSSGNSFINRVLELTNAQRLQAGAVPLTLNSKLNNAAQAHSEDMALHDFFNHKGSNGSSIGDRALASGYQFSRLGENIAAGYATPEDVVQGWLNSPGHRANILNPSYREIGIGYYYLANDTGNINHRYYWTQDFGVIST